MSETKVHEKTLKAPKAILNYPLFSATRIIFNKLDDSTILITAVSRTGDVYLLRWCPEENKEIKTKYWTYHVESAYDTTDINVGVYHGDWSLDKIDDVDHDIDCILSDIVAYDGQAINPRDKDGFLRLRPRYCASTRTIDKDLNVGRYVPMNKRKCKIVIDPHPAGIPQVQMNIINVTDDDDAALALINFIQMVGNRIETSYSDRHFNNVYAHDFSPFYTGEEDDFFGETQTSKSLIDAIGDTIDTVISDVSKDLGLTRVQENTIYRWLCNVWKDRETYDGIRGYQKNTFSAIQPN